MMIRTGVINAAADQQDEKQRQTPAELSVRSGCKLICANAYFKSHNAHDSYMTCLEHHRR
jgi:hypothetical protein